ncbi:MAG: peptide chain release factor N(5)-glutamine methyltransferase, partial [Sphaerochaetaceae bacterium]
TLIPRPDTETLITVILEYARGKTEDMLLPIIDIGTGSGAIGITLALELGVEVTLSDISKEALAVAEHNAIALAGHSFPLIEANLLSTISQKYGIIVSNPPYLTAGWCDEVSEEVAWEPRRALDGFGPDGLSLVRNLIEQSTTHLRSEGALFLECDYRQVGKVATLLEEHHFKEVTIVRDLAGHERVVWGVLASCMNS